MKKNSLIILVVSLLLAFSGCRNVLKDQTDKLTLSSTENITNITETTKHLLTSVEGYTAADSSTQHTIESTLNETTSEAVPTTSAADITEEKMNFCSIEINCKTILKNSDRLKEKARQSVPSDGIILNQCSFEIKDGDVVLDVLLRICEEKGIEVSYVDMPVFNSCYIEGINGIFEKDCGSASGWMYSVNGEFPQVGANAFHVSEGDTIRFVYTCDGGLDIGDR